MVKKALLIALGIVLLLVSGTVAYMYIAFPAVGEAPDLTVEGTPGQIERGKYLANHVTVCIDCHSERDWTKFSGPIIPGTEGKGGDVFDEKMGFPGTFYARNITPHNLKDWTDGDIYRTITTGVSRDGSPLFPVMPFRAYAQMDPEDIKSIIAYIRTLEPIDYKSPASRANFPVNLIMRTMPQQSDPMKRPEASNVLEYGKYLVTIGACGDCHTPAVQGAPIDSLRLAGGFEFEMPGGVVRSANLTPHKQTGIGNWTEEQFLARFKLYDVPGDSLPDAAPTGFNTVMPWNMYAGMTEQDLKAIFAYLQSLDPIEHRITRFTPRAQISASE